MPRRPSNAPGARPRIQRVGLGKMGELDPSQSTLSIDITSTAYSDLSPRFGFAAVGGEYAGEEP